jgi:hypothetical protein
MNVVEVAWAAGLWEGEGCFHTQSGMVRVTKKGERRIYSYPRASMTMTDLDVLDHFCEVVGVGRVKRRARRANALPQHKNQWVYTADSQADVERLAELLLPWMGERRAEQIERVIFAPRGRVA